MSGALISSKHISGPGWADLWFLMTTVEYYYVQNLHRNALTPSYIFAFANDQLSRSWQPKDKVKSKAKKLLFSFSETI